MPNTAATTEILPVLALTMAQAAKTLGVSPRTIFNMIKDEKLRAFKIGASVRISAAAIAEFIEQAEKNS